MPSIRLGSALGGSCPLLRAAVLCLVGRASVFLTGGQGLDGQTCQTLPEWSLPPQGKGLTAAQSAPTPDAMGPVSDDQYMYGHDCFT